MDLRRLRIRPILVMAAIITGLTYSPALTPVDACICMPPTLAEAYSWSSNVFIAKPRAVADHAVSRWATTFTVDTVFKGPAIKSFTATGESAPCGYRFELGETYLIYADKTKTNGALCLDKCMRVRRLAAATTDLQYIDGVRTGRPQGLVTGSVLRKGRDRMLHGLRDTMDVVATGSGASYSVRTEPGGHFTLVLPPGEFEVRLTHQDKTILPPQRLVVTNGATVKHSFVIESSPQN